jgi:hypothetical protein
MQHTDLLPERVVCCPFLIVMENTTEIVTRKVASNAAHKFTTRASYLLSISHCQGKSYRYFTRRLASIFDIRVRDLCRVEDARLF